MFVFIPALITEFMKTAVSDTTIPVVCLHFGDKQNDDVNNKNNSNNGSGSASSETNDQHVQIGSKCNSL